MAIRSDDQDDRRLPPAHDRDDRQSRANRHQHDKSGTSLPDTLRELAVTVAGFIGAILLITAAAKFLPG